MKGKKETKTKQILTTTTKENDIVGTAQIESGSYFFVLQEWEKPKGKETEKEGLQHFLRLGLSHAQTDGLPSRRKRERY